MNKIIVCVKQVVDTSFAIRPRLEQGQIKTDGAKNILNPFDEVALEEAIRFKESGAVDEVIACSIGNSSCQDVLRTAMAMGADRAIHIETAAQSQPLSTAKLLKAMIEHEVPKLILLGKQSSDFDSHQTGQMLAALLGWSQGVGVSRVTLKGESVLVSRATERASEELLLTLPAVVSVDLHLNEPRYIKLPNLMKARKKQIETLTPEQLGVRCAATLELVRLEPPPQRAPCVIVADLSELIEKLCSEAKVI